jgi:hypothetical protein
MATTAQHVAREGRAQDPGRMLWIQPLEIRQGGIYQPLVRSYLFVLNFFGKLQQTKKTAWFGESILMIRLTFARNALLLLHMHKYEINWECGHQKKLSG